MKKSFRKTIIIIIVILTAILSFIKWFSNGLTEYYSEKWVSISKSKKKGAFVREVMIKPKKFRKDSLDIEFAESWVEEQTKIEHSFLFLEHYVGTKRFNFCFTTKKKYPLLTWTKYFFVNEGGRAFAVSGSGDSIVFYNSIDKNQSGQIKLSFVKSWHDNRDTGIIIKLD